MFFFDSNKNKSGKGVTHRYEAREHKGEKIVLDHATGLMWQESGSTKYMNYAEAQKYLQTLRAKNLAGFNDWRLPTLEEAMSLMAPQKQGDLYLDRVFDHQRRYIWISDHLEGGTAWVVNFDDGYCNVHPVDGDVYVRVVRGG